MTDTDTREAIKDEIYQAVTITQVDTHSPSAVVANTDTWNKSIVNNFAPVTKEWPSAAKNYPLDNVPEEQTPDKQDSEDFEGLAEQHRTEVESSLATEYEEVGAYVASITTNYFFSYKNINRYSSTLTMNTDNIKTSTTGEWKTDPNSEERNFVVEFQDQANSQSAANLNSAREWLEEELKQNANTIQMIDEANFFLNKANESKTYVNGEEVDFDVFDPNLFKDIESVELQEK